MNRAIAIGQTLGILVLMSLGTVLTKLALSDVAPLTLAWLSVVVGLMVLTIYTFVIRRERVPRGLGVRVWAYIIAIGICNFVIVRLGVVLSLDRLSATTQMYLINFVGFLTMAMSIFILRTCGGIWRKTYGSEHSLRLQTLGFRKKIRKNPFISHDYPFSSVRVPHCRNRYDRIL